MEMTLKEFLRKLPPEQREDFARRCDTTVGYLKKVAYKAKTAGEGLCMAIEKESWRQVKCETLRPDVDWAYMRNSSDKNSTNPAT